MPAPPEGPPKKDSSVIARRSSATEVAELLAALILADPAASSQPAPDVTPEQPTTEPGPGPESHGIADLQPEIGIPLPGLLPVDLAALQHSADAFFEQLAQLTAPGEGDSMLLSLGPWVLVAGGVAWELSQVPAILRRARLSLASVLSGVPTLLFEEEA
jgi:hypothetical protein